MLFLHPGPALEFPVGEGRLGPCAPGYPQSAVLEQGTEGAHEGLAGNLGEPRPACVCLRERVCVCVRACVCGLGGTGDSWDSGRSNRLELETSFHSGS